MDEKAAVQYPLRSLALIESVMTRLWLHGVPPFSLNIGLAAFAVGGGMLLPGLFGGLAGSLLAMQGFVIMTLIVVLCLLLVRKRVSAQRDPERALKDEKYLSWLVDFVVLSFVIGSFGVGGIFGPLEYLVLAGATILGTLRGRFGPQELADIGVRCAIALLALSTVKFLCGLPDPVDRWPGASGSIAAAGVYFSALAYAEGAGIYPPIVKFILKAAEEARRNQPPS